jgi:hypothetical protein
LHGRDPDRGKQVFQEVRGFGHGQPHRVHLADFASLDEVRRLAGGIEAEHERLDALINNAGIGAGRPGASRELSRDGSELRFQVNYLASFLLTSLLLPLLRHSTPARVVNVTSAGQAPIDFDDLILEHGYDGWRGLPAEQAGTDHVHLRPRGANRGVGCDGQRPSPGDIHGHKDGARGRQSDQQGGGGSRATLRLVAAPQLDGVTGKYFDGLEEARAHAQAYDPNARRKLWGLSEELCGLGVFAA